MAILWRQTNVGRFLFVSCSLLTQLIQACAVLVGRHA